MESICTGGMMSKGWKKPSPPSISLEELATLSRPFLQEPVKEQFIHSALRKLYLLAFKQHVRPSSGNLKLNSSSFAHSLKTWIPLTSTTNSQCPKYDYSLATFNENSDSLAPRRPIKELPVMVPYVIHQLIKTDHARHGTWVSALCKKFRVPDDELFVVFFPKRYDEEITEEMIQTTNRNTGLCFWITQRTSQTHVLKLGLCDVDEIPH